MNVTVCVKRVPSTASRIKVAADGTSNDEGGIEFILNPFDEFAVEEALKLVDQSGSGEVTIVSLGPAAIQKELRTCLAMGATKAVHLVHEAGFRDPLQVARALASAVKDSNPDVVLLGRQAVDNDNAQIGPMMATLLDWPAVVDVVKVEAQDAGLKVEREVEGGDREIYEVSLPCVLTAQKGLNEPRYPNLKGIMAAKKKPIDAQPIELTEAGQTVSALELPPERQEGKIVGEGAAAVDELLRILRDDAGVL